MPQVIVGVAGANRQVKKMVIGVGGANRDCKEAWAGVGGVNRKVFASGIPLGELPLGTLVKDVNSAYFESSVVWMIADKNHAGYPGNSVTLLSKYILCLKCFDAKESGNQGDNRWIYSNIRQWLNSAAGAGQWYTPAKSGDTPPASPYTDYNRYQTEAGFLNGFTTEFQQALLPYAGDKMYLLSSYETYYNGQSSASWGSPLSIFPTSSPSARQAYPTQQAIDRCSAGGMSGWMYGSTWDW